MNFFSNFIFDLDGVLLDSSEIHNKAFQHTLIGYDVKFKYDEIAGSSTFDALTYLFRLNHIQISDKEIEELVKIKRDFSKKLIDKQAHIFPCVNSLLEKLINQNKNLFLATSASWNTVNTFISLLEKKNPFKDIITAEDVLLSKPSPDIYTDLCKRNSLELSKTIVFEDSVNGLLSAQAANLKRVYIGTNEKLNPNLFNYRFDNLCDVLNYVK